MNLSSEIDKVRTYTESAYEKLEEKGAEIPEQKNLQNLDSTIDSIPVEDDIYYTEQKGYVYSSGNTGSELLAGQIRKVKNLPYMFLNSIYGISSKGNKTLARLNIEEADISNWSKYPDIAILQYTFDQCKNLITVNLDGIDFTHFTYYGSIFSGCTALENILGTFSNINIDFNLYDCPNLTRESVLNVINGLSIVTNSPSLRLHSDVLKRLSAEDKALATTKGWKVTN